MPGTAHGYHVNTFGFLCGEIVRRAAGEPLRARFARLAGDAAGVTFGAPPGADVAEFVFDPGAGDRRRRRRGDERGAPPPARADVPEPARALRARHA